MKRHIVPFIAFVLAAFAAQPCRSSVSVEDGDIVFRIGGIGAAEAFLVGDFNGWNPTIDLMAAVDHGFEIRLFLLPGTYRYRFLLDGVSKSDPDNPCADADGNSCFTLAERDGALTVYYAQEARGSAPGASRVSVTPSVRIDAVAVDGAVSLFSTGMIAGSIDRRIDTDLAVGLTEELSEGSQPVGNAFLLRGLASYRFSRGVLRAFSRPSEAIDLGDAIGLFGSVGPYRYPVSLFSRGLELEGALPLGFEGRILYANRLRGYRSDLEGAADSLDLFSRRDYVDSDVYGLWFGTEVAGVSVRYLFREDRRRREGTWLFPAFGEERFRGFERDAFHGFSLSLAGDGGVVFDGELLIGRSYLEAANVLVEGDEAPASILDISREIEWEHGHRLLIGISRAGERLHSDVQFARTTLEGDRAARAGRSDGSRTSLGGTVGYRDSSLSIDLSGKIEQYSSMNTGSVFWLGRTNFWLDGDELSYDLIPFLSSRAIYEISLSCGRNHEALDGLPWGRGLRLEVTQRSDGSPGGPLFREIHLSNGVALHSRLTLLLDMRGASYRYERMRRDFVDAFFSIHWSITKSLWCCLGTGVNPCVFDRWLYAFSSHGRDDYLYGRGVFRVLAARDEAASMKALIGAEEALAEDWAVTLEAGFTF
jgi:hypothetical protein